MTLRDLLDRASILSAEPTATDLRHRDILEWLRDDRWGSLSQLEWCCAPCPVLLERDQVRVGFVSTKCPARREVAK